MFAKNLFAFTTTADEASAKDARRIILPVAPPECLVDRERKTVVHSNGHTDNPDAISYLHCLL